MNGDATFKLPAQLDLWVLGPVYTKGHAASIQSQCCDDACDIALIEINENK